MRTRRSSERMPKKCHENPFNTSEPVKDPRNLFGRKDEIGRIMGLLFRQEGGGMQCVSIVGERKIGKTSLVNILLHRGILKSHKIDTSSYVLIYMNIAERRVTSQESFLEQIMQKLIAEERVDFFALEKENDVFSKIIRMAEEIGHRRKIILFLDEFEAICDIWSKQFGGWLRALNQDHGVGFVTVTLKPLSEIQCKIDGEIQVSPFPNIFQDLVLGLLDENSSREMIISMYKRGEIELHEDEVEFLLRVTGGNPFFIQLIGSLYFEERKRKKKDEIDMDSFNKEAYKQAEQHLEQFWKNLDERESEYLMRVREGHYEPNSYVEYDLERRGLLKKEGEKILFFSPLFGEFVQERIEESKKSLTEKLKNFVRNNLSSIIIFVVFFLSLACFILGGWDLIKSFVGSFFASLFVFLIPKLKKMMNL